MSKLDKYSRIKYRDTTHLYWNKFPYKVVVCTEQMVRPRLGHAHQTWAEYVAACKMNRKQHRDFILSFKPSLPTNELCRIVSATGTLNFFFVNEGDTEHFIDCNKERVFQVCRPASAAHHAAMFDHKVKVRQNLFHDKYRWCVVFQPIYDDRYLEFFEWEKLYFRDEADHRDEERSRLFIGGQIRLYLRDETDVIFTKLGTSDIIARIEKIVLVSEVETMVHETQFDAKTG